MKFYLAFLLSLLSSLALADGKKEFTSFDHVPMVQVGTGSSEVHFNLLVPKLPKYSLHAYKIVNGKRFGNPLLSEAVGEAFTDEGKLLHEKAIKLKISGLEPDARYEMDLIQTIENLGPPTVLDTRTFSTFSSVLRALRLAVISCMSDDLEFTKIAREAWNSLLSKFPDLILLLGDQTYVDTFKLVKRGTATALDVVQRYFTAFSRNPMTRATEVVRIAAMIDDHDTGIDNGNKDTPTLEIAQKAFRALYGSPDVPGYVQNGKEGLYSFMTLRGMNLALMDGRSFRTPYTEDTRFGHWGQVQEESQLRLIAESPNPTLFADGGLISSELIFFKRSDGSVKRITEGMRADHPANFSPFMKNLMATQSNVAFLSGDIHASQIVELNPDFKGTARYWDTPTLEITSSPMHSVMMYQKDGMPEIWDDPQRIVGKKIHNFSILDINVLPPDPGSGKYGMDLQASFFDYTGNFLFSHGRAITRSSLNSSKRRTFLSTSFKTKRMKKVKVAFFDMDQTVIRFAPNTSAIEILPGVADKIAALNSKGYLVALMGNENGIADGTRSFGQTEHIYLETIRLITQQNPKAVIHYYDFSDRGAVDFYSKPNPGMPLHLWRRLAQMNIEINWFESFLVGDSLYAHGEVDPFGITGKAPGNEDRLLANELNMRAIHPKDFFGWKPKTDGPEAAVPAPFSGSINICKIRLAHLTTGIGHYYE